MRHVHSIPVFKQHYGRSGHIDACSIPQLDKHMMRISRPCEGARTYTLKLVNQMNDNHAIIYKVMDSYRNMVPYYIYAINKRIKHIIAVHASPNGNDWIRVHQVSIYYDILGSLVCIALDLLSPAGWYMNPPLIDDNELRDIIYRRYNYNTHPKAIIWTQILESTEFLEFMIGQSH